MLHLKAHVIYTAILSDSPKCDVSKSEFLDYWLIHRLFFAVNQAFTRCKKIPKAPGVGEKKSQFYKSDVLEQIIV